MSALSTLVTYCERITGKRDDYDDYHEMGINWAIADICRTPFYFLLDRGYIDVTENVLHYNLASDFNMLDKIWLYKTPNKIGNVTTWTLDTSADATGHVDAALDDDAGENSIITIDEIDYVISSVATDGTAADDIEINFAADSGTVSYIGHEDYTNKGKVELKEAEKLSDIRDYEAANTKNPPAQYYLSEISSGSTPVRKIWIGNPTSDDSYRVAYDYFKILSKLTSDTDESTISQIYRNGDDLICFGAAYYCYRMFWHEDRAEYFKGIYDRELAAFKEQFDYRGADDWQGAWTG